MSAKFLSGRLWSGCLALCCLLAAAPAPRPATIISEPKKAVVEALEDRALPEPVPLGTFTVYAYCPCTRCCGQWSGGPTASGTMPEEGRTIAADWDVLPAVRSDYERWKAERERAATA